MAINFINYLFCTVAHLQGWASIFVALLAPSSTIVRMLLLKFFFRCCSYKANLFPQQIVCYGSCSIFVRIT
jgi:hypothetical protein